MSIKEAAEKVVEAMDFKGGLVVSLETQESFLNAMKLKPNKIEICTVKAYTEYKLVWQELSNFPPSLTPETHFPVDHSDSNLHKEILNSTDVPFHQF